jgi:CBS domain-containing protein
MPVAPAPDVVERPTTDETVDPDRPWVVLVWNDPINLMSYVAFVFRKLFGYSKEEAERLMSRARVEKLLLLDASGSLRGLITMRDVENVRTHPKACRDARGRLRVGAAIGVRQFERVEKLLAAEVDVIVIDTAHGHSENVLETVREVKKRFNIEVIATTESPLDPLAHSRVIRCTTIAIRVHATAKLGQPIVIRDGVSYIAIRPLPTTDVGRDAEVTLEAGQPQMQAYHEAVNVQPALLVNAYFYKKDAPITADALKQLENAYGGFVVEMGDEAEYAKKIKASYATKESK